MTGRAKAEAVFRMEKLTFSSAKASKSYFGDEVLNIYNIFRGQRKSAQINIRMEMNIKSAKNLYSTLLVYDRQS